MRSDVRAIRRGRIFLCTLYFFPESPMTKHRSTSTKETATLLQRNKETPAAPLSDRRQFMATVSYSSLPGQTHPSAGWIFQQSNARTVTDYWTEKERHTETAGEKMRLRMLPLPRWLALNIKRRSEYLTSRGRRQGRRRLFAEAAPGVKNRRGGHDEGEHRPRRTQTHSGDGHVPRGAWWWRQRMLMLRTRWTRPRWFRFRRP